MMASILITGGAKEDRVEKADKVLAKLLEEQSISGFKKSPDYFLFESSEPSIGIEEIRQIEHQIYLRPYVFPIKAVVIAQAELLTIPAQNAFLKTLEEPPSLCVIILCSSTKSAMLPTIISRCQHIILKNPTLSLSEKEQSEFMTNVPTIFAKSLGPKFLLAEVFGKNKETALIFMEKLTIILRSFLLNKYITNNFVDDVKFDLPAEKLTNLLKQISVTKRHVEANVSPRFALENLFLTC